jgi:catecholate siderophore receptor
MNRTRKLKKNASLKLRPGMKFAAHAVMLSTAGVFGIAAAAQTGPTEGVETLVAQPPAADPTAVPNADQKQPFNIAPTDLTSALDAFAHVTGMKVHSNISNDELAGFRSRGAKGLLTPAEALHQILHETGLEGQLQSDGRSFNISIRNTEQVDVTASAQANLQQFQQPLLDTAQTVALVPQYILSEQADTTLRDSLRNVPGVSIAAGEGGSQGDSLTIRGFNARNDIYLDGIRDFGSYYRDSFNYSSVDVLEGPASVEFGRGSTGGVVNQETKQPEVNRFVVAGGQFGTNLRRRGTLDINQPIEAIPGGTAFRLNLVAEQTDFAGRDVTTSGRYGVAPSISFGLKTHTRATISYLHEHEDDIPDYGLPYYGAGYAKVPTNTFYGLRNGNFLRTTPDIVTGRVEHDFGLHLTLRNTLRWANYPRTFRITEPQINSAASVIYTNADGKNVYEGPNTGIAVRCAIVASASASCFPFNTPLSQVLVKRNQINGQSTEDILWDNLSATYHFNIKHVSNSAVVMLEGGRERSDPYRPGFTLPYVTALNPNPDDAFAPTATTAAVATHVASLSYGIDFLDTLELTRWLELSGGVRFDYFSTTSTTPANNLVTPVAPALSAERLDKQPTYRAAIVIKPRPAGSIYFDWGTSFNPAAESLSLSGNNATSAPEYNETYELGAKWNFLRDRLNLNGSVFRTEKLNARETDPNNSQNTINAGNQLVRGVQIGALGHLPESFDLIVGYAFLDGRVESSVVNASPFAFASYGNCPVGTPAVANGVAVTCSLNTALVNAHDPRANTAPFFISPANYPLANVPKNSGNFWVTHSLKYKIVGGFGGNYVAARRASSTALVGDYESQTALNPASVPLVFKAIPGYTTLNLLLRRPIGERFDAQFNLNNLTNKFFIDQPHPGHLVPGERITALFGVNYKF